MFYFDKPIHSVWRYHSFKLLIKLMQTPHIWISFDLNTQYVIFAARRLSINTMETKDVVCDDIVK